MIRRTLSILLFLLLFLAACTGALPALPEATLVRVTPLPTNTAVVPTATSTLSDAPLPARAAPTPKPTTVPAPVPAPVLPTLIEQMDAFMSAETSAGRFSGVALVATSNDVIFLKAYGYADREQNISNTPRTRFPIGTLTIPFTAMAVMQLQEQGKLSLDDSICDYLAECPQAWSRVHLRHLLNQTSGIFLDVPIAQYQESTGLYALPETTLAQIRNASLTYAPGTRWEGHIDSASYILLGLVIERASGQAYETFLHDSILDPLGMADTSLARDGQDRAVGYSTRLSNQAVSPRNLSPLFSAAGLASTSNDMLRWGQALLAANIGSLNIRDAVVDHHIPMDGGFFVHYGWFMADFDGHYRANMPGVGPSGYRADMAVFPQDDLICIVLANQGDVDSTRIGNTLIRMVFAEP